MKKVLYIILCLALALSAIGGALAEDAGPTPGVTVTADASSPTGYTVTFVYEDADAQVGVTYTYRVIPIHEELLQEGVWLEGQSAAQVAQARWTYDTLLGGLVDWLAPAQEPTPSPTERTSLFW